MQWVGRKSAAEKHRVSRHCLRLNAIETTSRKFLRDEYHGLMGALHRCD